MYIYIYNMALYPLVRTFNIHGLHGSQQTLLAQLGCFETAEFSETGIIFTRKYSDDNNFQKDNIF